MSGTAYVQRDSRCLEESLRIAESLTEYYKIQMM